MERAGICHSDGFDLAYRIEGEGAPILVIGSAVYYPRLFSSDIKQKYQWVFVDHRGFAKPKRELRAEDSRLDAVLADIERMRTFLQLEDVTILGHSGHAFMALEYARTYPKQVRKVALFNTAPDNSEERQRKSESFFMETASLERKKRFEKDIANLPQDIDKDPKRRFVHMCIRAEAKSFYQERPHAAALWDGVFTNMPIIDELWGNTFARIDLIQRLADVRMPVYIGLGRYDYLVAPVALWDAVDGLYPHVDKVIFERSGHQPMLEEPEAFDQSFSKWLDQ